MSRKKFLYTVLILFIVIVFGDNVFAPTETVENTSQQASVAGNLSTSDVAKTLYKITKIVDGDTVKIEMNGKVETVRLIGVDTPEVVDPRKPVQCFGREASAKTKEWLLNRVVKVESDSTQDTRDKYGRLLLYIYRDDGLFINRELIAQGYAHEYTYDIPYKYQKEFKEAEMSARENQQGLWSRAACAEF